MLENLIYKQKRIGHKGKPFTMYKFRTMYIGAEKDQSKYKNLNEATYPTFKVYNDPRFTRFGKFLSHTGLDELPQFVNVLKGEMALVGPRPLPVSEVKKLDKWMLDRHSVKPGIISPWIFNGYHDKTIEEWMKSDLDYIKKKNPLTDLLYVLRAILLLLNLLLNELTRLV